MAGPWCRPASTGRSRSGTPARSTLRETLRGHSRAVQQPVFSPDGRTLYTVSHDGTAIAWDVAGERGLARRFTFTHEPDPGPDGFDGHPGTFSPDGEVIAVGLSAEGIGLWDSAALREVDLPLLDTGGEVWALAFAPNGRRLAAVTDDGRATVWDVERRSLVWGPSTVGLGAVTGVDFSADGRTLATAGGSGVKLGTRGPETRSARSRIREWARETWCTALLDRRLRSFTSGAGPWRSGTPRSTRG